MTPDKLKTLIEALRRVHWRVRDSGGYPTTGGIAVPWDSCRSCRVPWPCPPAQAADELERLGAAEQTWKATAGVAMLDASMSQVEGLRELLTAVRPHIHAVSSFDLDSAADLRDRVDAVLATELGAVLPDLVVDSSPPAAVR